MKKKNRLLTREVNIKIKTSSKKLVKIIYQALTPEIHASNYAGSKVKIKIKNRSIIFSFKAHRTTTLRALINSYLNWVITLKNSLAVINSNSSNRKGKQNLL